MKPGIPAATGVLVGLLIAGCASDDYGSSGSVRTSSTIYYGSGGWYNYPYYYYDDPDYVVVPPDRIERPGARPENPIAEVPPGGALKPGQLPAQRPVQRPGVETRPSAPSRMPSAQPRTSRPAARPSIPSRPRGGGFSRGGGRRR